MMRKPSESRGKKVEVHTTDMEKVIESYATMDELEGQLGDGFYRCHRGVSGKHCTHSEV